MNSFWEALSREEKQEYLTDKLEPGWILYLFCHFTIPIPKNKYLLLLHLSDKALFFVINSNIPRWALQRQDRRNHQVLLRSNDYDCLDHDSYINCCKIEDRISFKEMYRQLMGDIRRMKQKIRDEDLFMVLEIVKNSRLISENLKQKILESFPGFA